MTGRGVSVLVERCQNHEPTPKQLTLMMMPVAIKFGFNGFPGGEGNGIWIDGILISSYLVKVTVKSCRFCELAIVLKLDTGLVPATF
jgi:hypothetical protein